MLDVPLHRDGIELAANLARGTELTQAGLLTQLLQQHARNWSYAAPGPRELAEQRVVLELASDQWPYAVSIEPRRCNSAQAFVRLPLRTTAQKYRRC